MLGGGEGDTNFDQTVCVLWWLRGQGVEPLPSFGVAILGSLDIGSRNWENRTLVRRWLGKEMGHSGLHDSVSLTRSDTCSMADSKQMGEPGIYTKCDPVGT